MPLYIGIDIGKTKVAAGLIDSNGRVLKANRALRSHVRSREALLRYCIDAASKLIAGAREKPYGIGIGALGIVNPGTGTIISSSLWSNFKISKMFEGEFGIRTCVNNDVRAAALGESMFGASKEYRTSVYATISSGVSFCTIRGGSIEQGSHFLAGQIGLLAICEDSSSLESKFSGRGIANAAATPDDKPTTSQVFERARADPTSVYAGVIDAAVRHAAETMALIQNSIDPEIIVVGGSVANNQPEFVRRMKIEADKILGPYLPALPTGINITHSKLGMHSGIIGAASLAMKQTTRA